MTKLLRIRPARMLTPREVGDFLKVSVQTLRNYRLRGEGPPYIKLHPQTYRYASDELEAWLQETGPHKPLDRTGKVMS